MAVKYGYLALVNTTLKKKESLIVVPDVLQDRAQDLNLRIAPADTYVFDSYSLEAIEDILDNTKFYSELSLNILLEDFLKEKVLSSVFVPIATFD